MKRLAVNIKALSSSVLGLKIVQTFENASAVISFGKQLEDKNNKKLREKNIIDRLKKNFLLPIFKKRKVKNSEIATISRAISQNGIVKNDNLMVIAE